MSVVERLCPHDFEHNRNRQYFGYVRVFPEHKSVCMLCYDKNKHNPNLIFHSPHGALMIFKYLSDAEGMERFQKHKNENKNNH